LLLIAVLVLVECSYLRWIRHSAARRRAAVGIAPIVDLAQVDAAERAGADATILPMRKRRASVPRDMRRIG
jgi:outer membrane protein TolC